MNDVGKRLPTLKPSMMRKKKVVFNLKAVFKYYS